MSYIIESSSPQGLGYLFFYFLGYKETVVMGKWKRASAPPKPYLLSYSCIRVNIKNTLRGEQDKVHNVQGLVQNENSEPLVQNY